MSTSLGIASTFEAKAEEGRSDVPGQTERAGLEGWRDVRLGDVLVSVSNGTTAPQNKEGRGLPVSRIETLSDEGINPKRVGFVAKASEAFVAKFGLQVGDILLSHINSEPQIGRAVLYEGEPAGLLHGMNLLRLQVDNKAADPHFLNLALRWLRQKGAFIAVASRAVGQSSINQAKLRSINLLLPTLPEQKAIAAALRAVQEARDARRRELAVKQERKIALMEDLFINGVNGEPLKETEIGPLPESWKVKPVSEIGEVAYGLTVNATRRNSERRLPYLTVANVTRGKLRLGEVKEIGLCPGDEDRFRVRRGDLLLIEGNGNPNLLGSAAMWNDELPLALHQNHLIRVRLRQEIASPMFVMSYINSDTGRRQLLGKTKTSSGLHTINSRIVADLRVPIPPYAEQTDITEALTACDAKIDALTAEATLLDELFRAMLDELLSGRLSSVPLIEREALEVA